MPIVTALVEETEMSQRIIERATMHVFVKNVSLICLPTKTRREKTWASEENLSETQCWIELWLQ